MNELQDALRKILDGVFVVTTKSGEKVNGMTAVWVTRASLRPPMVTVAIGKTRFTHELIEASGVFAVNILSDGQQGVGRHFGFNSGRNISKFEGVEYKTALTGSPILDKVSGYFDCRVRGSVEAGDHTVFVGEVVDAGADPDRSPLLYVYEDFY